jgi:hypothetical protein
MFKAQSEGAEADLTAPQKVRGPPYEIDEPGPPARTQSAATYIGENKLAIEAETIRQVNSLHSFCFCLEVCVQQVGLFLAIAGLSRLRFRQ